MSWKSSIMEQRIEFVRLASVEGQEFLEACSRFGISRKTGYKWMARFKAEGEAGLVDRSRRPKKSPGKSSSKKESMVMKLRGKHPRWGGRKLRQRLIDLDRKKVPSASTFTSPLGRHGLLLAFDGAGERRTVQRFEREFPNELWQMGSISNERVVSGISQLPRGLFRPCAWSSSPWDPRRTRLCRSITAPRDRPIVRTRSTSTNS